MDSQLNTHTHTHTTRTHASFFRCEKLVRTQSTSFVIVNGHWANARASGQAGAAHLNASGPRIQLDTLICTHTLFASAGLNPAAVRQVSAPLYPAPFLSDSLILASNQRLLGPFPAQQPNKAAAAAATSTKTAARKTDRQRRPGAIIHSLSCQSGPASRNEAPASQHNL